MTPAATRDVEIALANELQHYYADPLGFVRFAYPWGRRGTTLAEHSGPDVNQAAFLKTLGDAVRARRFDGAEPVMPVRMAISSGHGTGKSAMGAWIANWIMSTRPHSMGTVTAGTATQLDERTWAAIEYWTPLCITAHWFRVMATGVYYAHSPADWKLVKQTCKEENKQSFAGQHARTSTSWYLFDEASAVPDGVWEIADGGLTDGEPMFFAWGQPERNTGAFYRVCFGSERAKWDVRNWDARKSACTNKQYIEEQIASYGLDSDRVRVRVLGLPPKASELQFIDSERVRQAETRALSAPLPGEPLVAGVDVSGGGAAWNVIAFRRGLDGRSIPRIRMTGETIRQDRTPLIAKCAALLADRSPDRLLAAMFVDSAYGSPIVERLKVMGFENVHEVNFGSPAPDPVHFANMRAWMYNETRDWLARGAISADQDRRPGDRLGEQLILPGAHLQRQNNRLVIESKQDLAARGERSPDDADALALTFAMPVAPVGIELPGRGQSSRIARGSGGWMT